MSLLGIDVGTTGCKAGVFSERGELLSLTYEEYDFQSPQPGWFELDARDVWNKVKRTVREATARVPGESITALAVSSLGEAVVPVTLQREILGPSILNFDERGQAYMDGLRSQLSEEQLYRINGNTLGNHYTLTKLMWIKEHQPDLYDRTDKFLLWSGFVAFMLGAEPVVDYSVANRTLLLDVDREAWSSELLAVAGLDREKLPDLVPSGQRIGTLFSDLAGELGLSSNTAIVTGAHDQCATAIGCGVIEEGQAAYGMGTFTCATTVLDQRCPPEVMLERGLNTEHHAVPGKYVTFIYNLGGSHVKWFRDTFAEAEHRRAEEAGEDIYDQLFAEIPEGPSGIIVLPHFTVTGPPNFISDSTGVIAGLRLETSRGRILKSILEGVTFSLKQCIDLLPSAGVEITDYRAVGGGSKSDAWVQLCADILGQAFSRPRITEAGALGAAIIAGVGDGTFPSFAAGIESMVDLERCFQPDEERHQRYQAWYERHQRLWPLMKDYLRELASAQR